MYDRTRNVQIWRGKLRGRTYVSLAQEHELSDSRISQIVFTIDRAVRRYAFASPDAWELGVPLNPRNQWKADALRGVWVEVVCDPRKPVGKRGSNETHRLYLDPEEDPR
jgi:hypothetical protein